MKIFNVTDKYSIEVIDKRQWGIKEKYHPKPKNGQKNSPARSNVAIKRVYGYYTTLETAKEDLAELLGKKAGNFEELDKWIKKIKEIK